MRDLWIKLLCITWGFAGGVIVATAIVAFVTMIGITPRIAARFKIRSHPMALENAASLGIIVGASFSLWEVHVPLPGLVIVWFSLCAGIFIGCLAVALVEVLDVIPIMSRRFQFKKGLYLFLIALAMGKLVGALYYWLYPGFFKV